MTYRDLFIDVIGENEVKRIDRWLDYCRTKFECGEWVARDKAEQIRLMLSILDGQEIEPLTLKIILQYYIFEFEDTYISDCCNWRGMAETLVNECGLAVEYREGIAHFYKAFIREGRTFMDNVIQCHITENYCRPWKDNEVNLTEQELRNKKILESMGLPF